MKVERQKFTRTVGGKIKGYDSEGSIEGGIPEVHWNYRREYRKKGHSGTSEGSSEGGLTDIHQKCTHTTKFFDARQF